MRTVLPILLRVLISLILVLNGAGYAAASTTIMTQADMAHHGHDSCPDADMPPLANESGSSDCCDSGQCVCSCAQYLVFTLVMPAVPDADVIRATGARTLSLGHAQPALPHPIRPPIA